MQTEAAKMQKIPAGNPLIAASDALTAMDDAEEIETRFGKIRISRKQPIQFPKGLLGMPDSRQFCLTSFPVEKFAQFRLLQSLEDHALSFIVQPTDIQNKLIEKDDLMAACNELGISPENLALLLVVSVHRQAGSNVVQVSVNARAPLLVDIVSRAATQYVFLNNKYQIRHMVTL